MYLHRTFDAEQELGSRASKGCPHQKLPHGRTTGMTLVSVAWGAATHRYTMDGCRMHHCLKKWISISLKGTAVLVSKAARVFCAISSLHHHLAMLTGRVRLYHSNCHDATTPNTCQKTRAGSAICEIKSRNCVLHSTFPCFYMLRELHSTLREITADQTLCSLQLSAP